MKDDEHATTPGTRPVATEEIVDAIARLLQARRAHATICPSDVARDLVGDDGPWRSLMPQVRTVAADLAREGRLTVTRRGTVVDATSPGGPIRLGLPTKGPDAPSPGDR